jgi:hypothetical protein
MCQATAVIEDAEAAQAHAFAEMLRGHIADMSARLANLEARTRDDAAHRDLSLRIEANGLHREISEARFLIERMRRRFPEIDLPGQSDTAASQ